MKLSRHELLQSHRLQAAGALASSILCLEIFRRLHPDIPAIRVLLFLQVAVSPDPLSGSELQSALNMTDAGISRNIRALVDVGLVEMHQDPFKWNRKLIGLTRHGRWLNGVIRRVSEHPDEFDAIQADIPEHTRPRSRPPRG